jgi:LTXXQ motif family protein
LGGVVDDGHFGGAKLRGLVVQCFFWPVKTKEAPEDQALVQLVPKKEKACPMTQFPICPGSARHQTGVDVRLPRIAAQKRTYRQVWPRRQNFSGSFDLNQRDQQCVTIFCGCLGGSNSPRRSPMMKIVVVGATALFLTASPIANAQTPSATPERLNAADRNTLTDLRIDLVKAALQLTPDQEKYWPAVESAIRARAEDRKARLAKIGETVGKRADESRVEALRNRDPITFLQRRSEALAQRSADLDKLAEAWQPLYKTFSPEQRQRMGAIAILVLHDMSDAVERRRAQSDDED